jgi:hypothetical protein
MIVALQSNRAGTRPGPGRWRKALGEGIDLRLTVDGITGRALLASERVVHLCELGPRDQAP